MYYKSKMFLESETIENDTCVRRESQDNLSTTCRRLNMANKKKNHPSLYLTLSVMKPSYYFNDVKVLKFSLQNS